ncbi:ABC transporter permease [Endozoicomonas lisbonensis]|uniref:ABC transport system permease protein n=2 Tax=Endozoicomonas lisbonensis TaxID=3120522 RepID=A0ABV2SC77_9GAMM
MVILQLVKKSLGRRKVKALVSMAGLALSLALLLMLVHVKNSVFNTLERVTGQSDLIVGAPSQPVHLAMYGLFRMGNTPPAISFNVYDNLRVHPEVSAAIPLSMMESHKGFSVTGTTNVLFDSFDPAGPLAFASGGGFTQAASVVLGYEVAQQTGYNIGEMITIAKGSEPTIEDEYQELFTITGILSSTGTVLDNSFIASLNDLASIRGRFNNEPDKADGINLILVRLHNRQALLPLQREIGQQFSEPLEIVIPDQELAFIQRISNRFGSLMIGIVMLTAVMALITVFFSVSSNLSERRSEIDTLRMLGARSHQVIVVGLLEPVLIIFLATVVGFLLFQLAASGAESLLPEEWKLWMTERPVSFGEVKFLLFILLTGCLLAFVQAWKSAIEPVRQPSERR